MLWLPWQGVVDYLVLTGAIYVLLRWARGTRAFRAVFAILAAHVAARIAWRFDLTITGWLLDIASLTLILLLLFFFQPELRRAFLRLDGLLRLRLRPSRSPTGVHRAVSQAAFDLAAEKTGALIVLVRRDSVEEQVSGGISLQAEVSPQLLVALFRKPSPLHDGAVLIEGSRLARAGVVLPLTQREDVPFEYGTRHRAAMGIVERSDAAVVVVSEERGQVTLMHGRQIIPVSSAAELAAALKALARPPRRSLSARVRGWVFAELRFKAAAAAMAAVLWFMSISGTGSTIRTVSIPIEFDQVPAGLAIASQSATRIEVQLRGSSWLLASLPLAGVVARLDLTNLRAGTATMKVDPASLSLPRGLVVERLQPQVITVRLAKGPG
ncbi:MAG: DNA integrity scanning protein DisA nucleotide-binding domain protein [Bryobacterales bacterium]|nr:DNA integrity scanning protein DisA nucleotide-binding domain protein [Bryobacterales bacterium]